MKLLFRMQFLLVLIVGLMLSGCSLFGGDKNPEDVILSGMDFWLTVDYTSDNQRENLDLLVEELTDIDFSKLGDKNMESEITAAITQMKMGWGLARGSVDKELGEGTFSEYIDPILEGKWKVLVALDSSVFDFNTFDEVGNSDFDVNAMQIIFWTEEGDKLNDFINLFNEKDEANALVFEKEDGVEVFEIESDAFLLRSGGLYSLVFGKENKASVIDAFKNSVEREMMAEYGNDEGLMKMYYSAAAFNALGKTGAFASGLDLSGTAEMVVNLFVTEESLDGTAYISGGKDYISLYEDNVLDGFVSGEKLMAFDETNLIATELESLIATFSYTLGVDLNEELLAVLGMSSEDLLTLFDDHFAFFMSERGSIVPGFGFVLNVGENNKDLMMKLHESLDLFIDQVIFEFNSGMEDETLTGAILKENVSDDFVRVSFDKSKIPLDEVDVLSMLNIKDPGTNLYLNYGFKDGKYVLAVSDLEVDELFGGDNVVSDNARFKNALDSLNLGNDGIQTSFVDMQEVINWMDSFIDFTVSLGGVSAEEEKISRFVVDYFRRFDYLISGYEVVDDVLVGRFSLKLK